MYFKGYSYTPIEEGSALGNIYFSDISFDKNKIAVLNNGAVLFGTDVGLFKWVKNSTKLEAVEIESNENWAQHYMRSINLENSVIIMLLVAVIIIVFLWSINKQKRIKKNYKEWVDDRLDQISNRLDECSSIKSDSQDFNRKKGENEKVFQDIKNQELPSKCDIENLESNVNQFYNEFLIPEQLKKISEKYADCKNDDKKNDEKQVALRNAIDDFIKNYPDFKKKEVFSNEKHFHKNHALILCLIEKNLVNIEHTVQYLPESYSNKQISDDRSRCLQDINELFKNEPEFEKSAILQFMQKEFSQDIKFKPKKEVPEGANQIVASHNPQD